MESASSSSSSSSHELKMVTDELAQGMEKAKQLRLHLCSTYPSQAEDVLLQRIISTFEKALYILKWNGQANVEPSISVDGSPRKNCDYGDTSKKRKLQPTWIEQVKVNSDNGLEGPRDDGYSWRKYGQKDILGCKHPRSYYRCTYRAGRNCWATKQVQRSDEDPALFEITYKGTHTCNQINNNNNNNNANAAARMKQEEDSHCHQLQLQNHKLKANLRVDTEGLDIQEMPPHFSFPSTFACYLTGTHSSPISALADDNHLGAYSSLFYSPATSESNFFSDATSYQMINCGGGPMQNSETDISAHASTTNSPIGGMEFSIDPLDLESSIPFNMSGFFT